jgi:RNA polymerase sigma-70 factor (ECF subfamily)
MMGNYQDILDLIAKNDPNGLTALYKEYGSKFYSYSVQRWHLTEDEAWEVVYQTLETLVLKLSNYQFESKIHFDNFLYKVLLNFIRQYFRKSRNSIEHGILYVDMNEEEAINSTISKQINKSTLVDYYRSETVENPTLIALNQSLNKLDPMEKDLLLLRAQNYTYDEIAKLLRVENNQLKVKHLRAKKKLINYINELKINNHEQA